MQLGIAWDYNSHEREAIAGSSVCSSGSFIADLDFATKGVGLSTTFYATEDIRSDNAMTDFSIVTDAGGYFAGGSKEMLGRICQVYFGEDTNLDGRLYDG